MRKDLSFGKKACVGDPLRVAAAARKLQKQQERATASVLSTPCACQSSPPSPVGARCFVCADCDRRFWFASADPVGMDDMEKMAHPAEFYGLCCPWCMGWAYEHGREPPAETRDEAWLAPDDARFFVAGKAKKLKRRTDGADEDARESEEDYE